MAIRVALRHRTTYAFDRPVNVSPHEVRLRPAPHVPHAHPQLFTARRAREAFSELAAGPLRQLGRALVFPERATRLEILVDLVADMTVINPFDFFVEPYAESYPFVYAPALAKELIPFLETAPLGSRAWAMA